MGVVDSFEQFFVGQHAKGCAFNLIEYFAEHYVGVDMEGRAAVVVLSTTPKAKPLLQESKSLKIECNVRVTYSLAGKTASGTVHVLTCLISERRSVRMFLELADLLLRESERTAEGVLSAYHALSEFFSDSVVPTDNELLGLYGELFTICDFSKYDLASCWQSTDRMKYDFSVSESVKIEVKSTLNPQRVHRFKHDQVIAAGCDVYVVSYLLRPDDEGVSLYELIGKGRELCADNPKKILKLQRVIKNTGSERLQHFTFNQDFTRQQRRIYHSVSLPHFEEEVPEGVSGVEYDIDLIGAPTVSEKVFLNILLEMRSGL